MTIDELAKEVLADNKKLHAYPLRGKRNRPTPAQRQAYAIARRRLTAAAPKLARALLYINRRLAAVALDNQYGEAGKTIRQWLTEMDRIVNSLDSPAPEVSN